MDTGSRTLLGQLLLGHGLLSEDDLAKALRRQQGSREPLGEVLVSMGLVTRRDVDLALRAQSRLRGRVDPARTHLLVVDDDPEVGAVVGDILAGAGYSIGVAQSGDEALAALAAADGIMPSLIVLDLNMPGKSGLDILPLLAEFAGHPIPVLVLTGRADLEAEVRARSPHVRAFLPKPTGARDLVRAVDAILSESPVLA